jgi:aspartate/methionine/tyrosine aminotransferase
VPYPLWLTKLLVKTGLARVLPAARRLTDGGASFLHYYSDRVFAAPLDELLDLAGQRAGYAPDAIDLNLAQPTLDLAPAVSSKLPPHRRGYPPPAGLPELRGAVADLYHADPRLGATPIDEVLITHGGAGAFCAAADAFVNRGDRVVLFDPCSPLFGLALRHRRANLRWVPTWLEDGQTRFHLEPFVKAMRGAKLLALADPANPTGGALAPEDVEQIAWWANRFDVLIYQDEAFDRFRYEGDRVRVGAFPGASRRTLLAGSLSQGYGLPAARVGWLAGSRHLVRPCAVTASLAAPFVPTVCQVVALAALRGFDEEAFARVKAEFAAKRRYAFDRLQALGLMPGWPAGGFFLWVPVGLIGLSGRRFAADLLRAGKVIVGPGDLFGPGGGNYVRVSFAADDGRLREGLNRIAQFVAAVRQRPAPSEGDQELLALPAPRAAREPTDQPA